MKNFQQKCSNPLDKKFLDWPKLKAFADNTTKNVTQN